jgi:hypothetical protein
MSRKNGKKPSEDKQNCTKEQFCPAVLSVRRGPEEICEFVLFPHRDVIQYVLFDHKIDEGVQKKRHFYLILACVT